MMGVCVVLSTPGFIIALRKSAGYGMAVNFTLYVFAAIIVVWLPLFQNAIEYGAILPENCKGHDFRYHAMAVVFAAFYWLILQIFAMPLAVLIRRLRRRSDP
jgi:hypothetical protein